MPRLTPDQLAARRMGLGATDVVEALGLAPWDGAGPMRLFLAKTTERPDDEAGDNGAELSWGHVMEPVLISWYEQETGRKTLPGGHVPHPTESWLWATLDASVIGESLQVEAKNVGSQFAWHWDASSEDGVPRYVRAQVTIGMACSGKRLCDVVASVGGRAPHIWTVAYDEELARLLIDGARDFWRLVEARKAPPLDATSATKEYLRAKYPSPVDRIIVEASAEVDAWGKARHEAAQMEKRAAEEKTALDARILDAVGEHDGVLGDGWKMTWKTGKDGVRRQRFTGPKEE